jgi:shikimate kinase
MKIIITGPRSVGKTTISKELSKVLKLPYFSSDDMMEESLKKFGGLNEVIKSKDLDKIMDRAIPQIKSVIDKNNFVYDLAGGAVSSSKYKSISEKVIKLIKGDSIIIGLFPFEDRKKSVKFLLEREKLREHFKDENLNKLKLKVERDYNKLLEIFPSLCNFIFYVEDKGVNDIVKEILNKISSQNKHY